MKKYILTTLSLFFLIGSVSAQQIEKRLLALNERTETLVAPFTEVKVMPKLKKEIRKEGNLYFQYPNALSMRYTNPEGDYSVIKDGGKFYTKRGQKKMKLNLKDPDSQFSHLRNTLIFSLSGDVEAVAKENDAKIKAQESATRFLFTIEKKHTPKVGVCRLQLVYDKVTGALLLLKMEEVNGNYTSYETIDPVTKKLIPQEVWEVE